MIRFQRIGRTNEAAFRIVVLEKERAAKTGNIVEQLGTYNPHSKALTLDEAKVKEWIGKGAQPTDSIHNLLVNKGIIEGKKVNVLPRKSPVKSEEAIAAEAAAAQAASTPAPTESVSSEEAAPAVEEATTPDAPTEAEVAAEAEPAPTESVGEAPAEVASETTETPAA